MKQKHQMPTRKKTALRRCVWLVGLIVLLSVTGLYRFLPAQAVMQAADTQDIENPAIVDRFYDPSIPGGRLALHYLVDGDDAMMLCVVKFHPQLGFYASTTHKIETWEDAHAHAGLLSFHREGEMIHYLFGRIEDDAIHSLKLLSEVEVPKDRVDKEETEILSEEIFERDGVRYFLARRDNGFLSGWPAWGSTLLQEYDDRGKLIEVEEVHRKATSI